MACGANLELSLEALGQRLFRETAEGDAEVHDEIVVPVRMLPLLEGGAVASILKDQLEKLGWAKGEDGSLSKSFEVSGARVTATLSPDASEVRVAIDQSAKVSAEGTAVDRKENEDEGSAAARAEAEKALADVVSRAKRDLEKKAVAIVLQAEKDVRDEVAVALSRTYREALEKRAREMGTVESITENGTEGGGYEVRVVLHT